MSTRSTEFGRTNDNTNEGNELRVGDAQFGAKRSPVRLMDLITPEELERLLTFSPLPPPIAEQALPAANSDQGESSDADTSSKPHKPRNRKARAQAAERKKRLESDSAPKKSTPRLRDVTGVKDTPKVSADIDRTGHDDDSSVQPEGDILSGAQDNRDTTNTADEAQAHREPKHRVTPPHTTDSPSGATPTDTEQVTPPKGTYSAPCAQDQAISSATPPVVQPHVATSVDTTPVTHDDGARRDDAYNVTYGSDEYLGPMNKGMPTRSQSRQVRELVASGAYEAARNLYYAADGELAGKVARRLKLGMFASKKTREAASAEVEAARPEYERMAETFDTIQIEKWKLNNPAISDEEINHKLAKYHEAKLRLQGLRAQNEILTAPGKFGKLSELNNKATEWFAGLSRKQKIIVGIGSVVIGAGAGLAVAAAGTILGGGAGVLGAGLLAGAKVYKTTTQGRAGLHRNTTEVNKADFKNADGSYKSIDDLRAQSSTSFKKGLDQRVERADKVNKKAKWMTIASAALLGAGVAGHIDAVHDVYKAVEGNIADYFGMTDHHDILPSGGGQGGGSDANHVDRLGSGDVYQRPSIDVAPSAPSAVEVAHAEFLNSPANTIPYGGGGEAFMSAHGINPSVWYNNQAEFLAKFPGEAYQMSDGNVGFAKPGGLSKVAVEFWAAKAGR